MIIDEELRECLKKAITKAGSLRKWAKNNGISPSVVSVALHKIELPFSPRIAEALGYKKVKVWIKKKR